MISRSGTDRYLFLRQPDVDVLEDDDLAAEAAALGRNPTFLAYLDQCRARGEKEGRISLDDVLREFAPELIKESYTPCPKPTSD